jgi:hypothetical protein
VIKYVVAIIQGRKSHIFISHSKKRWAYTLEEAKHFNRLCDATKAKNQFLAQGHIITINTMVPPPVAGTIDATVIQIDLIATAI